MAQSEKISNSRLALQRQLKRGKTVAGMMGTLLGGYRTITKLDGWQEPVRDKLPEYIQIFCRKITNSFDIDVIAVEPIPKTHGLWVSNHISWMDIPVIGSTIPAFFLSKAEVTEIPIFGRLAQASGNLFIKRGSGDAAAVSQEMTEFLQEGHSIVFYPEGTTSDGHKVRRLHGRLLKSAIDANKPIQPIVLCYVNSDGELDDQVPYYGGIGLKESLLRNIDNTQVTAYILPLPTLDTKGKTAEELRVALQKMMQAGLKDLHSRVLKTPSELASSKTDNKF